MAKPLIVAENLHLSYPTTTVFDSVTLGVHEGDRLGIVGRNGDGKSSLLSLLTGTLEPHAGRVTRRGGVRIGYLTQADSFTGDETVGEAIVGDIPEHEWASNPAIRDVIAGTVADLDFATRISGLSGGQRRRVALAGLLVGDWDVLALDEPTNHLDIKGIAWLARHIKGRWPRGTGAFLVITHDRWFLDEVCTDTWEVHDGRVEPFEGGYAAYVLQRVERDRIAAASETKRQNLLRKELAWLRRGAPARTSKPKFRIDAANQLIEDVPSVRNPLELQRLAVSRLGKRVIDLDDVSFAHGVPIAGPSADDGVSLAAVTGPPADDGVSLAAITGPSADDGVSLAAITGPSADDGVSLAAVTGPPADDGVSLAAITGPSADDGVTLAATTAPPADVPLTIRDVTWHIAPGERTGILGSNGSGKTTLLSLITGRLVPTSGRIRTGTTVRVGHLDQQFSQLADIRTDRVREVLARTKTSFTIDGKDLTPAQLLERLGFRREHLSARVGELSGGQKRRLQLLLLLLSEPNVIVLDEPTNDVDSDMLTAMEDLLDSWPGTLIVVSHDRYLIERITDQQYAIFDGHLRHLPGGIDEYLRLSLAASRTASPDAVTAAATRSTAATATNAAGSTATATNAAGSTATATRSTAAAATRSTAAAASNAAGSTAASSSGGAIPSPSGAAAATSAASSATTSAHISAASANNSSASTYAVGISTNSAGPPTSAASSRRGAATPPGGATPSPSGTAATSSTDGSPTQKLSGAERHAFDKEIASIERRVDRLQAKATAARNALIDLDQSDYQLLNEKMSAITALEDEVAALEERWFELLERRG